MVFVFDLDGTLLLKNYRISENMTGIINKLDRDGHVVIFASGRMLISVKKIILSHFKKEFPVIAYNGSIVWHPEKGIIFETGLDFDTSVKIIQFLREKKIHRQIYINDKLYSEEDNDEIKMYARHANVDYYLCEDLLELIKDEKRKATKILAIGEPDMLDKIKKDLTDFKLSVDIFKSMKNFLDIVPRGINKAVALKVMLEESGKENEKIIAFGDNHNDVPLFEVANVGVAVKNAVKELKEVADYVVPSNDEDGIYSFFVNFFPELID
ncbi:HAD family phosphatase [Thermosipho ferrireducens]|uniref:HAD family phosphatase n=1 Tax=Thermosipho ferrireducens TaxID=2571116 RepID=A0ABX7S5Y6_9BACT|nr:HAD family hydrolase [Thermosipho ferrireducens]QTA37135.1 HAD family phosphatase [Thermosipho ferrireducens]